MPGPSSEIAGAGGDDRGVSEVIAFVLVFGIVLSSVALLSMTGFQAMDDYQQNEQLRNAERAMEALAENVNDVLRYDGIDQRYGELSLREGTVTTGSDGTEVQIFVDGNPLDDEYEPLNESVDIGRFDYETDSRTIAYEGGGVVRSGDGGSAALTQPRLRCNLDGGTAIVSLVAVDATERSIQSSGNLGFTVNVEERHTHVVDAENVSIGATTTYDRAWNASLSHGAWESTDPADLPGSADVAGTCGDESNKIDRVVVNVVVVDVNY